MKKLCVLLAIAFAITIGHSATCYWSWSASWLTDSTGAFLSGGEVVSLYAIDASSDGTDLLVDTYKFTGTESNAAFDNLLEDANFTTEDLTENQPYAFYLTILDNNNMLFTLSDESILSQVSIVSATTAETGKNVGFGMLYSATINQNSWTPVPEPTSGLLLLIGAAGLALRRKRA